MLKIGCHLSLSKGYYAMGKDALSIGANTFQFFTRNPRGGSAKEIEMKDAQALAILAEDNNFAPLLAHAPYTLNLCSSDPKTRVFGQEMMADDLSRLEKLPCKLYNFHPGSHTGQGIEKGISQIVQSLNKILKPDQNIMVLLEGMSGKGSEVGGSFEELKKILDDIILSDKMGICLDTCHLYDAGYDIVNNLDKVLTEFDKIIGLKRLKAIHLNDSMNLMGSHRDRHAEIGKGTIGLEALCRIINHPELYNLPFFLETPVELEEHAKEIKLLKGLYKK